MEVAFDQDPTVTLHRVNIREFSEGPVTTGAETVYSGYPVVLHSIPLLTDVFLPVALDFYDQMQGIRSAVIIR